MTEEQKAVLELMQMAYLVQETTDYCVFINFSGHVNYLDISVRKSKEEWETKLLSSEIVVEYSKLRKELSPNLAELKAKINILRRIIEEHEIPYDDCAVESVQYVVENYLF